MEVKAEVMEAWRGQRQGANRERREGGKGYPNKNRRKGEIRCEEGITKTVPQVKGSRNGLVSELQESL